MKLINTADPQNQPPIVMLVYGEGGVGKTTFTSTAPNPIIADCENGSKYFGLRGISVDAAVIESWSDMKEFLTLAKDDKYETVVIDPIGELMEKLKAFMSAQGDSKLVQKDGNPTMAGWGWLKDTMRKYVKILRDSGKHVIIVAHLDEKPDEDRLVKRPEIQTKLSSDLVNIVDIVGYMTTYTDAESGEDKRIIIVDPSSDKMVAKDRTGQLGRYIPPHFGEIVDGLHGNKKYKWMKEKEEENADQKEGKKSTKKKTSSKTKTASKKTENEPSDEQVDTSDLDPFGEEAPKEDDTKEQLSKARNKKSNANSNENG